MKASVFTGGDGEPVVAKVGAEVSGIKAYDATVAELDIASEHSLRVAAWALQRIAATSACPGSRRTAEQALRAVGRVGDLETGVSGYPLPIKLDPVALGADFLGNPWQSSTPS